MTAVTSLCEHPKRSKSLMNGFPKTGKNSTEIVVNHDK